MDADEPTTPTLPGMEHLAPVAVVKDDASPTVRRTARRRIMLEAGLNPATARPLLPTELGRTCGDCVHAERFELDTRAYWKCTGPASRLGASHSAASDIRIGWPACDAGRFTTEPRTSTEG